MNANTHEVYCLYCREIRPIQEAEFVFHSAFYRNTYPLAGCRTCVQSAPAWLLPPDILHARQTAEAPSDAKLLGENSFE